MEEKRLADEVTRLEAKKAGDQKAAADGKSVSVPAEPEKMDDNVETSSQAASSTR